MKGKIEKETWIVQLSVDCKQRPFYTLFVCVVLFELWNVFDIEFYFVLNESRLKRDVTPFVHWNHFCSFKDSMFFSSHFTQEHHWFINNRIHLLIKLFKCAKCDIYWKKFFFHWQDGSQIAMMIMMMGNMPKEIFPTF